MLNRPLGWRVDHGALSGVAQPLNEVDQFAGFLFEVSDRLVVNFIQLSGREQGLTQACNRLDLEAAILELHLQGIEDAVKLPTSDRRTKRFEQLTNRSHGSIRTTSRFSHSHRHSARRKNKLNGPPSMRAANDAKHNSCEKESPTRPLGSARQLQRLVRQVSALRQAIGTGRLLRRHTRAAATAAL